MAERICDVYGVSLDMDAIGSGLADSSGRIVENTQSRSNGAVSYTHLDVYKRQGIHLAVCYTIPDAAFGLLMAEFFQNAVHGIICTFAWHVVLPFGMRCV